MCCSVNWLKWLLVRKVIIHKAYEYAYTGGFKADISWNFKTSFKFCLRTSSTARAVSDLRSRQKLPPHQNIWFFLLTFLCLEITNETNFNQVYYFNRLQERAECAQTVDRKIYQKSNIWMRRQHLPGPQIAELVRKQNLRDILKLQQFWNFVKQMKHPYMQILYNVYTLYELQQQFTRIILAGYDLFWIFFGRFLPSFSPGIIFSNRIQICRRDSLK